MEFLSLGRSSSNITVGVGVIEGCQQAVHVELDIAVAELSVELSVISISHILQGETLGVR